MKTNLGKTLRSIRKGKQMTLEDISDKHLSISQISRFERNESEISAARLINILDKLNISMEEFLIVHNQDNSHIENFSNLIQFIRKAHMSRNVDKIKELLINPSEFQLLPKEITMIKSIIYPFDSTFKPSEEEIGKLIDYLFKIDQWGYYEITLLGNCSHTMNYPSFFILTKEMLKNYIYSHLNKTNKKLVTQLAINCLIISIDNEEFENCTFLIEEITELTTNEDNYFEKIVFLYAQGYFEYKKKIEAGRNKMKKAIHIFELLDEEKLANAYREHYNEHVKET